MKLIYRTLGIVMVGLGFLGIVLPVLPTTPFLLLALWFFSRSSDRLRRWLLTNRMFGQYISDYSTGRGIPMRVKIYALALMWTAIGYSALWIIDPLWLKILLFAIAAGTTIHILRIRTKNRMKKIVILVPTREEAEGFASVFDAEFTAPEKWHKARKGAMPVVVSGVGMAAAAAATASVASACRPDAMILAGIAGAYPWSGFVPGDCVLVASEHIADLGAIRDGGFTPLYPKDYDCALKTNSLPCATGHTVNCTGHISSAGNSGNSGNSANVENSGNSGNSANVENSGNAGNVGRNVMAENGAAQVENMEGAAFFAVCGALGIPFAEVRAVSNMTTDERDDWQVGLAIRSLTDGVKKIMDEIKN